MADSENWVDPWVWAVENSFKYVHSFCCIHIDKILTLFSTEEIQNGSKDQIKENW